MATETDELNRLTANRLEHEQDRLMQAHYADAVPPPVLKREQDRILTELDTTNRRINAHHGDHADARAHLDDALNILANCAKVYIDEDNQPRVENNHPFETLPAPRPTPSPGHRTATRPELKPSLMFSVRALYVWWTSVENLRSPAWP